MNIVPTRDAELDAAVAGAMVAKMRHSAETRTAANRFYVEAGIVEDFTAALTESMAEVVVGNGFDEGVTCGPMIDANTMIAQVNDTEMGLAGYLYTRGLVRGLAVSEQIQAGMIGLNRSAVSDPAAPFGGMKQSGLGREGSTEGIYEFCETQYIATDW